MAEGGGVLVVETLDATMLTRSNNNKWRSLQQKRGRRRRADDEGGTLCRVCCRRAGTDGKFAHNRLARRRLTTLMPT
jgi:hypothetical protein